MTGRRTPNGETPSGEPSLDPRTWLESAARAPEEAPAGESPSESFDPRSWTAPKPAASASKPATLADPSRRRLVLGGAAAGVTALGGLVWLATRDSEADTTSGLPDSGIIPSSTSTYTASAVDGYPGLAQKLENYGVAPPEAARAVGALRSVAGGDPGRMRLVIQLRSEAGGRVVLAGAELRRTSDGVGYQIQRQGDAFVATRLAAGLVRRLVAHPRGQVNRDGLYASAVDTVSPDLMTQFGEALAFDFDIAQEVREGDQFEIVHEEQVDAAGDAVGAPKLLFAFLSAGGKDRYLYRFKPGGEDEAWFDDRGRNTRRAFMRTPLDGARITSLFGERTHPVFHDKRMHKGVDFGCGIGTQIFAAADGVVGYAGPATGFGVLLKLTHADGLETWYGHLSGFPDGIAPGAPVRQGQFVALSGNVGFSTGPHLHYEVHKDGVAVDPKDYLDVQGAGAATPALTGPALDTFLQFKTEIDVARRSQT